MVSEMRASGIRAELYLGEAGMRAQLRYADKRAAPLVVIEGGDELARGEVTLKDMALGAELSSEIKSRNEWAKGGATQTVVKRGELTLRVQEILERNNRR
jgi:histidyl-tRNA synthetase